MDFVRPARKVEMSLVSGRGHYDSVIRTVMDAQQSVWIATANLKELMVEDLRPRGTRRRGWRDAYRSIMEVFSELAGRGVELKLLHGALPSRPFREEFDKQPKLVAGGLEMRMCPRVHLKLVIVDGRHTYMGSANWTGAGLGAKGTGRRNFEMGLWTTDEAIADDAQMLFDHVWRGAGCEGCKLRDECEAPLDGEAPKRRKEPVRALVKLKRRPPRG